jgi:translocation and assembly module TamB
LKALRIAAATLGLVLVALLSLLVGVLLHLDTRPARRVLVAQVSPLLENTFRGRIVIDRLESIGPFSVSGLDGRVLDERGSLVIRLTDAQVRFDTLELLRSGAGSIHIPEIRAADGEVVLQETPAGSLTLVESFEPIPSTTPSTSPAPRVRVPRIELEHVWVHGALSDVGTIDAETSGLAGSFSYESEHVRIVVDRAALLARALPRKLNPDGTFSGRLEVPPLRPVAAELRFDGKIGVLTTSLDGVWRDEAMEVALDVPQAGATELNQTLSDLGVDPKLRDQGSLSLRAYGPLHAIDGNVRAVLGGSEVEGKVRGSLAPKLDLDGIVRGRRLDLSRVVEDVPRTSIDLQARSRVRLQNDVPHVAFTVGVESFEWDRQRVPAVNASGTLVGDALSAEARVAEPGLPVDARVELRGKQLDFRIEAKAPELSRVARVPGGISGAAALSAHGTYGLTSERLEAVARVSGTGLSIAEQKLEELDAHAKLSGPLSSLSARVEADAERLVLAGRHFSNLALNTQGSLAAFRSRLKLETDDASSIDLALVGSVGERVGLSDIALDVKRRGVHASATLERVSIAGANVEVHGLALSGLGELTANAAYRGEELELEARGKNLDLARIGTLLGVSLPVTGAIDLDSDLKITPESARGSLTFGGRKLAWDRLRNVTLDGKLELAGRSIRGNVSAQHRALQASLVARRVELTGNAPLTSVDSWKRAVGEVELRASGRIPRIARLIDDEELERYSPRGRISLDVVLSRKTPDTLPDLRLSFATRRLSLVEPELEASDNRRFVTAGTDLACTTRITGQTRETELVCSATSRKEKLAELRIETVLPPFRVWQDSAELLSQLQTAPLDAHFVLIERSLDDWPSRIRPKGLSGRVGANVKLTGTLLDPRMRARVWGSTNAAPAQRNVAARLDLDYDGSEAQLHVALKHRTRSALTGDGRLLLSLKKLLRSEPQRPEASARVKIDELDLGSIPVLKDNGVGGFASGHVEIERLGSDKPEVSGDLELNNLRIGTARLPRGKARLALDDQRLSAAAELEQKAGRAKVTFDAVPKWNGLIPGIELDERVTAKLDMKGFRAAAFLPVVRGSVSEIDGRLDADLRLDLQRGKNDVRGYVKLSDGVVQVPAVGQVLDHINLHVVAEPGGRLRLKQAELRGVSGKLTATGAARLNGFRLESASLGVRIREKDKLPVTVEGVSMGDAWGSVDLSLQSKPDQLELVVDVRSLHLELPPTNKNKVQDLDPDPHVRIGVQRRRGAFLPLPVQPVESAGGEPLRLVAKLRLGNDIWIRRGPDLDVRLGGELLYRAAEKLPLTGQIRIASGKIDVQGKLFSIDEGTVTFEGDPANPIVVASASWESPEGIVVFAEYKGPVDGGKLTLRAEPALTRDQIISLLLFGSPDGSFGTGEGSSVAGAASVGGGVATKGLNRALSDLTDLDVSTRIDTSEAGSPRPELVLQLSPRVSAQLGYNVEQPAPGKSPDRTLFTLEFRLFRRWLLASTFGDRGTSLLDLLWRYRY